MQTAKQSEAAITLTQLWDAYREICVSKQAGDLQIRCTKKAFFAGAHALFVLMLKLKPDNPVEMTAESIMQQVKKLAELHDELDRFVREG